MPVTPLAQLASADEAARLLAAGGLVGLPTETVYGLAADAANLDAVRRVFRVKGRPADHPLIVHLADSTDLDRWAREVPPPLRGLTDEYWPGPLTVIVPKQPWVPLEITGGLDTVALRVPGQPLALAVINRLAVVTGRPSAVVAPSANRFGAVSPTTAEHVRAGLAGRLGPGDGVLDGGPCAVGVESTIVAWLDQRLQVLRPGAVVVDEADQAPAPPSGLRAPGTLAAHYAPRARVVLADDPVRVDPNVASPVGLLAPAEFPTPPGWLRLAAPTDAAGYAEVLYAALRQADEAELATVVAVPPAGGSLRGAVVDRLSRAAVGSDPRWDPDRPR